jgi:hypothetical protein
MVWVVGGVVEQGDREGRSDMVYVMHDRIYSVT